MSFDFATAVFQVVNFLVLVAVLYRLLWKPLRNHMQQRSERIEARLKRIEEGERQLAEGREDVEQALEKARRAEADSLRQAELEAEAHRAELIDAAHRSAASERERILEQALAERAKLQTELVASLAPTIARMSTRIVTEIVDRELLHRGACERFASRLGELDADDQTRLASARLFEIESADEELSPTLLRALGELRGAIPAPRVEPELLAGVRLIADDRVYDGSLAAQIRRTLEVEA